MHRSKGRLTNMLIMPSMIALLVGLLIVTFYTPASFAYNSRILDTDANTGLHTSIALDSSKKPYISYYDSTNANLMFAYLDTSGFWIWEKVDDAGNVGMYSSLSIDTSGTPHISYYDQLGGDLRYAYKNSTGWQLYVVPDSEGDVGKYTSLALDSSNNPHISYYDADNQDLKYAYKDAGKWYFDIVPQEGNVGSYTSLALDSSGRPHISYYDAGNGNLKYAYKDTNWHVETVDSIGNVGLYTSIAIDSSGNPHISYYDTTNGRLKYAYKPNSIWLFGTVDSDGNVGTYTSIVLDSSQRPHISYYDSTNRDLKHAYKDNSGTWRTNAVDGAEDDVGSYSCIKLDDHDNLHISYYDSTNGNLDLLYLYLEPPLVINTNPTDGETHVLERRTITVTFNKNIKEGGDYGKIALKKGDTVLVAATTVSGNTLTISPSSDFENNTSYTVYIPTDAIRDLSGNTMLASYTFSFSIQPDTPPGVTSADPGNGTTGFKIDKNITITFNESINAGTNNTGLTNITLKDSNGNTITSNKGLVNNQLIIDPQSNLGYSTSYTITIPANTIKDAKGSSMPQYTLSFTTQPLPDQTAPTVSSTDPTNGSAAISIYKTITITFNENIQAGSAYANIALAKTGGSSISISKGTSGKVLTIDPTSNLDYSTNYTVTIPASAIKDMSDNALASSYSFNFTIQDYSSARVPTNLKATSTNPNIALAWDKSDGAVKYNIYRKEGLTSFSKINADTITNNLYTDTSAQPGKTYTYYVTAIDSSSRESSKSNEISVGLTVVASEVIFKDVQASAWYKTYLNRLIELKAIGGYTDGTFRPNARITRGELIKILSVAMNWQLKKQVDVVFMDAPPNGWVYPFVQKAIANGAMGGYTDGTFRPNTYITRAELAKVIASSLDLTAGTSSLKDVNQSWAKDYINACAQAGIIKGYSNGTFNPGGTATRAEAVAMVYRMLSFKK